MAIEKRDRSDVKKVAAPRVDDAKMDDEIDENSIIAKILDPDNTEVITLFGESGQRMDFEQIALVPHGENLFVVLKPLKDMEGIGKDEAIVFRIDYDDEGMQYYLRAETEQANIDAVFDVYSKLFEDAEAEFDARVEGEKNS